MKKSIASAPLLTSLLNKKPIVGTIKLLLALILPLSGLLGQLDNYQKARLTLQSGEVMDGQASLESDLLMRRGINFYKASNRQYEYYASEQIKSLSFLDKGSLYEPVAFRWINVMTGDSIQEVRLSKFLVGAGETRLYRVVLDEKEYYNSLQGFPDYMFYLKEGESFTPLVVSVGAAENGSQFIKESYKGVLRSITRDWPESAARTKSLNYRTKPIVKFFSDYLAYLNPDAPIETDQSSAAKMAVRFKHQVYGALGGWAGLGGFDRDAVYGGGYRMQFSDLGQSNALSIVLGIGVFQHNYAPPPSPTDQNYFDSFTSGRFTVGFSYALVKNKPFQPYLQLAFHLNRFSTTFYDVTPITRGVINPETGRLEIVLEDCIKRPEDYSTFSAVPSLGIGANYGRLWVELTYDRFVIPRVNDFIDDAEQAQPMLDFKLGYTISGTR